LVLLDQPETVELLEQQDQQGLTEDPDQMVSLGQVDRLDNPGPLDPMVPQVSQDSRVRLGALVGLDRGEDQALLGRTEIPALQDQQDQSVPQDFRAGPGPPVVLVFQDLTELWGLTVSQGQTVRQATPGLRVLPDRMVSQGLQGTRARLGPWEPLEPLGRVGPRAALVQEGE